MIDPTIKTHLYITGQPYNGYLNISPLVKQGEDVIQNDLTNLDSVCDHNSCSELIVEDSLDYIPVQGKAQIATGWMTKISHGGSIIFTGIDIRELGRLIFNSSIDLTIEANKLLYGEATNIFNLKKGLLAVDDLINIILSTNQFKIDNIKWNGPTYIVKAIRN